MYYYQLNDISKHELRDVESSNYGWYVQSKSEPRCYLHTDGQIHDTTEYCGEWTGYFKTEQEAIDAKLNYEAKS